MPLDYKNELFIQVDAKDRVIGKITRGQAHRNHKIIHRAVQVVLINGQNQTLLQKRSHKKDKSPNMWGTAAGGHVSWGHTYQQSAQKELHEEIGLTKIPLKFVTKIHVDNGDEQEILAIFIGQYNQTPTQLDPDEVVSVKWVNLDELPKFAQDHTLTDSCRNTYQVLGLLPAAT